jgi:hypothetical protein
VPGEDLRTTLIELGLIEREERDWLVLPPKATPPEVIRAWTEDLEAANPTFDMPNLKLLDPARPVRYYRGRWRLPGALSGSFLGRRPQAYGADLWCFVRLKNGKPERFVDLFRPLQRWRGCDEAWRLQLALDSVAGHPQLYSRAPGAPGRTIVSFFSPLPSWAQRRFDAVGEPLEGEKKRGSLIAYSFDDRHVGEELKFAREMLWLADVSVTASS